MSTRDEFSKAVKLAAFERAKGCCEQCHQKIYTRAEYDHVIEDFIGGDNTLENCRCLCKRCHAEKTQKSRPQIDKTRRMLEKRAGARGMGRGFPKPPDGYDPWNRRMRDA